MPNSIVARARESRDRFTERQKLTPIKELADPNYRPEYEPCTLNKVKAEFQSWLHMPDCGPIEITLATYAANVRHGDPVWVLLVGGPSGGKTELIQSLFDLEYVYPVSTLSCASLLSGTPKKDIGKGATGGILRLIEAHDFGVILFKDWTSVISENRDRRDELMSALREIFDGEWDRTIGAEGGRVLHFKGKCGIIGGTTTRIDDEHKMMAELGPRFLIYRMPKEMEPKKQVERSERLARSALKNNDHVELLREYMQRNVCGFFSTIDFDCQVALTRDEDGLIVALAPFVVQARSAVSRDGKTRQVIGIPDPEGPTRLVRELRQLWIGLKLIGVSESRQRTLIRKVALDCVPPLRRVALDYLMTNENGYAAQMLKQAQYPEDIAETSFDRALEDLRCLGIVKKYGRNAKGNVVYEIAAPWKKAWKKIRGEHADGAQGRAA